MLTLCHKVSFLKETELFSSVPDSTLQQIAEASEEKHYAAQDVLMHEGEHGDALYLIVEGEISLLKDNTPVLTLGVGACLGEMALLDNEPRSATIRASTDVVTLRLIRDDFRRIFEVSPEAMRGMYHLLTNKIRTDLTVHVQSIRSQEQINQDIRRAYEIQQSMLPQADLILDGMHISGYCNPAADVGGDFYDYAAVSPHEVGIFIGDVTGHGFYSGLVVAMAKSCLITQFQIDPSVESVMRAVNRIVYPTGPEWIFMTVFYALLDRENKIFTYVNGGHNFPYHYHHQSGELTALGSTSIPVGIFDDVTYTSVTKEWQEGDVMILYSDGVIEAENAAGEMFGETRFEQCIHGVIHLPIADIKQTILNHVDEFVQGVPQQDDITLMIVQL